MASASQAPVRIEPLGRVAAGVSIWRERGELRVTIIVKATFSLVPDADMQIAEPLPLVRGEAHLGNNPTRSVSATSELLPYLPRADVVLLGHAVAPHGEPVQSLPVRLAVYGAEPLLDKTVLVHGDRRADASTESFTRMPLIYERALGGVGWDPNPLGKGTAAGVIREIEAANIVDPEDPAVTAGFGPISRAWPARRRLVEKAHRKMLEQPIIEIPEGFEWAYFQAAPEDQRIDFLEGDEWVVVEGVHAEHLRLGSRLPGATARARIYGPDRHDELPLAADMLIIESDELRCSVVWRAAAPLESEDELARIHIAAGIDLPGRPLVWPAFGLMASAAEPTVVEPRPQALAPSELASTQSDSRDREITASLTPEQEKAAVKQPVLPFPPIPRSAAPMFHALPRPEPPPPVPRRAEAAVPFVHRTPLVAFSLPWQMQPGVDVRAVVIKGTFDIVPDGPARLRSASDPPMGDVHQGIDAMHSLLYPTDFAIWKPSADVTLRGHAHAPGGSSPAAIVGFRFGHRGNSFNRNIAVFGDRRWQEAVVRLGATDPRPFQKMPLIYERAFGGPTVGTNPIGLGRDGSLLPNLEDPDHLLKSPSDSPEPVCFCGVPALWPSRRAKMGTYGAAWRKSRWPYFPEDFDWSYQQAAPPSQQLDHLQGDEPFELIGMHASHPKIEGTLPGLRVRCFAQRTTDAGHDGAFFEIVLRLDTASFDVDDMKLSLVHRGLVEVADGDASDIVDFFLMIEEAGEPSLGLEEARARYRAEKHPPEPEPESDPTAREGPPMHPHPGDLDRSRRDVEDKLTRRASLDGLDLSFVNLSGLDFSGQSLAGALLQEAQLRGAELARADLTGAQLGKADLSGANLEGANLEGADLSGVNLTGAKLDHATLTSANFTGVRAAGASFCYAKGAHPIFAEAVLSKARFTRAELDGADFTRAELDEAVFEGAKLPEIRLYDAHGAQVSFREASMNGARADGARLPRGSFLGASAKASVWDGAELDEAVFVGAALREASFTKASCRRALFTGADLAEGRLGGARLSEAAFLRVNLMNASLEGADLCGADLRGSNLHGAELWKADLRGANLDQAIVTQTKLKERA